MSTVRRLDPCPCGSGRRYKDCHGNLSVHPLVDKARALRDAGELDAARATLAPVLRDFPRDWNALDVAGLIAHDELRIDDAEDCFRRAIELSPAWAEAHFHLSVCRFFRADYASAWSEFAWRTRLANAMDYSSHGFGMPRWSGEPLAGRDILLHAEQGLGDTIHLARFAMRLRGEGAEVDLWCQKPLVPLLSRVEGFRHVTDFIPPNLTQAFHAPMADIAAHYLPTRDSVHWTGPYLAPLPDRALHWRRELAGLPRPLIGIAWKGNPLHRSDRRRSLPDAQAARLVTRKGSWVSLQFPATPLPGAEASVRDLGADWEETCAIVDALDLVISVDTSIAHLAGAMGKPVWGLLPFCPDWRWGLGSETTPWYPSMRLFRQDTRGDWDGVIGRVREAIASFG